MPKADYCIEINYSKEAERPSRLFRCMYELIETFQSTNKCLVKSINVRIEPILMNSSARRYWGWFNKNVADYCAWGYPRWCDLESGQEPIVGQYLVRAKYAILNFFNAITTIIDINQIKPLQDQLFQLAEETNVRMLPDYTTIQLLELIEGMQNISSNLSHRGKVAGDNNFDEIQENRYHERENRSSRSNTLSREPT